MEYIRPGLQRPEAVTWKGDVGKREQHPLQNFRRSGPMAWGVRVQRHHGDGGISTYGPVPFLLSRGETARKTRF